MGNTEKEISLYFNNITKKINKDLKQNLKSLGIMGKGLSGKIGIKYKDGFLFFTINLSDKIQLDINSYNEYKDQKLTEYENNMIENSMKNKTIEYLELLVKNIKSGI